VSLEHVTEHEAEALARLALQYVGKPRLEALLRSYVGQVQALEDALWQLATLRSVDTAEGWFLDALGAIVGAERHGLNDADYRAIVRATIRANVSDGGVEDIYAVAVAALGAPAAPAARLRAYAPASFVLWLLVPPAFDPRLLADLVMRATDAGVGAQVVAPTAPLGVANPASFQLAAADDAPAYAELRGFTSAVDPSLGVGRLARAFDHR
jgi:hypothetical protein